MNEPISTTAIAYHGLLAVFGAVVHAAKAHQAGQAKTFIDIIILTLMSSFSGVMFSLLGIHLFPEYLYVTLMFAGTGGFLGVEGMTIIISKVKQLIR